MQVDRSVIAISSLSGNNTDSKDYWLSRPPQERIRHIEELRRINYGNRASERLQRFFEVAQR